jgi:hypothetical protein
VPVSSTVGGVTKDVSTVADDGISVVVVVVVIGDAVVIWIVSDDVSAVVVDVVVRSCCVSAWDELSEPSAGTTVVLFCSSS